MEVEGQSHARFALPPGTRPATHFTGGWAGPSAGLYGSGKFRPHRDFIPGPSRSLRVSVQTTQYNTCSVPKSIRTTWHTGKLPVTQPQVTVRTAISDVISPIHVNSLIFSDCSTFTSLNKLIFEVQKRKAKE
jgi:hypothetical protein